MPHLFRGARADRREGVRDPVALGDARDGRLTFEPGDLINTGTPPGVGMGLRPPVFLSVGDTLELGARGFGSQRQRVVAAAGTEEF